LAAPLSAPSEFDVGAAPFSVAVSDFNRDGKLDLAVANYGSNDVSVLIGNGDGTFHDAVNYGTGMQPLSVAVGDFNGDGKLDLVVANSAWPREPQASVCSWAMAMALSNPP
jgi:hypothetical protein